MGLREQSSQLFTLLYSWVTFYDHFKDQSPTPDGRLLVHCIGDMWAHAHLKGVPLMSVKK